MDNATTTQPAVFAPVTIGTTPAGQVWTARKASEVTIMTTRLEQLWTRHNAKQAQRAADEAEKAATIANIQQNMARHNDRLSQGRGSCGRHRGQRGWDLPKLGRL